MAREEEAAKGKKMTKRNTPAKGKKRKAPGVEHPDKMYRLTSKAGAKRLGWTGRVRSMSKGSPELLLHIVEDMVVTVAHDAALARHARGGNTVDERAVESALEACGYRTIAYPLHKQAKKKKQQAKAHEASAEQVQ